MQQTGNFALRDEIKAYWSERAATFDEQPGHEIFSDAERAAWLGLIVKHVGPGGGRRAVDLACGTAVVSHLLADTGFRVTGIDWAEPMLERARIKAGKRQANITFRLGDAENTMEQDGSADVVACRHLVWTLVDPKAAFHEWFRVLAPGGQVLIIDGDFVNPGFLAIMVRKSATILQKLGIIGTDTRHGPGKLSDMHNSILSRVYFSKGARAQAVAHLLKDAGFEEIRIDTDMSAIHREQRKNFSFFKGIERATQHRYAISALKPSS